MARLRQNFVGGELDAALTDVATTMSSPALAAMVAVTSPDTMAVVLDPDGIGGAPEIVTVTAHTAASTTATITRGAEGTTARAHVSGMEWGHGPTKLDVDRPLLHVRDEKAANTSGGPNVAGWQTRTLNTTVTNEVAGASLSGNQITLPAGTYEVEASAPAYYVNRHKIRLRNITTAATALVGTSEYAPTVNENPATRSFLRGQITLNSSTVLELQHYTQTVNGSNGLGLESNSGEVEIYAHATIRKVG